MTNVDKLRGDVDDVKDQMVQNIGKVIERGEKLEDLNERTENLNARAGEFQFVSKALYRKVWWQNVRYWVVIIIIVIVILLVLAGVITAIVVTRSD